MFEFHWPWMALLILLPLLARLLWPRFVSAGQEEPIEGRRTTLLYSSLHRLQASFGGRGPGAAISGKLQALLLALLWIALTLAAMRPQWLEPHIEIKQEGYDLMLAVDTSRSMTALDFTRENRPVSRMAVVKGVMGRFVGNRFHHGPAILNQFDLFCGYRRFRRRFTFLFFTKKSHGCFLYLK